MTKEKLSNEASLERARALVAQYSQTSVDIQNFSALIMGIYGSGKTTFLTTGVKPILIDSFDPRGTIGIELALENEIKAGNLVIRKWWDETSSSPKVYKEWEKQWMKDVETGMLKHFGTYAIDSATTFIDALANQVAYQAGRKDRQLAIQDYPVIYNTLKNVIKMSAAQETNFLLTAHLVTTQDEITGEVLAELDTYKKLKSQIPLLFTEKYIIITKQTPKGVERVILTQPTGRYVASSQFALKGLLEPKEVADLKVIMKKAGLSTTDKPSLT